ncbi:MAG: 50S ribosomal protein L25 [wastewater metagenome]|nr:50S ribosomal protein L25 [Candidatus Loosdrechtia aerotolerans]
MEILDLIAEKRTTKGSRAVKKLRKEGNIPAILYGHNLDNVMLSLREDQLSKVLRTGARMIRLSFDNKKESALVKDVQYDTLEDCILHVDFSRIDLNESVTLWVPVELIGEAAGVKEGGMLAHVMKDVEIECLPTAIPEKIKINISELGLGKSIHVRELPSLEGVRYISNGDLVVVSVHQAAGEKEVPEEELLAEPEVITKKPKEEEAGGI